MTVSRFTGDDDLHDLIGHGQGEDSSSFSSSSSSEMKPLNLDHLSQGKLDVPVVRRTSSGQNSGSFDFGIFPCFQLCCAYLMYCCDYAPRFCWCLGIIILLFCVYALVVGVFFNPTEHFGTIDNDYLDLTSKYDLTMKDIKHWCLREDDNSCRCQDPLLPEPRGELRAWKRAYSNNALKIQSLVKNGEATPDIAFVGESIVEAMSGTWFGAEGEGKLKDLKKLFDKNFNKSMGASLDGVALGIAGDTNPTVLWRLMNGEMSPDFKPKIWWLELGLNDLARAQCSEEIVVVGILRIVEEILEKQPSSTIVINSLLPLADLRGGMKPGVNDFKDAFDPKLGTISTKKFERIQRRHNRNRSHTIKIDKEIADMVEVPPADDEGEEENKKKRRKKNRKDEKPKKDKTGKRILLDEVQLSDENDNRQLSSEKRVKRIRMKDDQVAQKKFSVISHHERKLPLWTSISAVNRKLQKFAKNTEGGKVIFFDATNLFTEKEDPHTYTLKSDMITLRGHPTQLGFETWEKEIVKFATKLLEDKP